MVEFFERLWPSKPDAFLTFWRKQSNGSTHEHLPSIDWAAVDQKLRKFNLAGQDVYFGVGLRCADLGIRKQGRASECVAWPGLWVDVDIRQEGAHAAQDLPPTQEAAIELIDRVSSELSLQPTLVVDSGYGLHVYYLFEQVEHDAQRVEAAVKGVQTAYQIAARKNDWVVDHTAKLQQVMRVPGFLNWKLAPTTRDVKILVDDGPRFRLQDFKSTRNPRATTPPKAAPPAIAGGGPTSPGKTPVAAGAGGGRLVFSDQAPEWVEEVRLRIPNLHKTESRDLAIALVQGEPFAKPGSRNATANRLAGVMVFLALPVKEDVTADELYEWFFKRSIERMAELENDRANPALSADEMISMLARSIDDAIEKKRQTEERHRRLRETMKRIRQRNEMSPSSYAFASRKEGTTPPPPEEPNDPEDEDEDGARGLILCKGKTYWVMNEVTGYTHPLTSSQELYIQMRDLYDDLLYTPKADGGVRKKTIDELVLDYGKSLAGIELSLTAEKSYFDSDRDVLVEAVAPLRPNIHPRHHPQIQAWLEAMGGKLADKLLDWLATLPFLDAQNSALYLSGEKSVGKTALARALANLWTTQGYTRIDSVVGSFNESLLNCPLVVADEELPAGVTTGWLRSFLGNSNTTINRKYQPPASLRGCPRLLLLGNNERMLALRDFKTSQHDIADVEAAAARFLHIPTNEKARDLWPQHRAEGDKWIEHKIAEHVLWLHATRKVKPGKRFLVEGETSNIHRQMILQGTDVALVGEWIVRFLANPLPLQSEFGSGVVVKEKDKKTPDGPSHDLLVESRVIYDKWGQYIQSDTVINMSRIGRALAKLGSEHRTMYKRYRIIDMTYVQQINKVMDLVVDEQFDQALSLIVEKTPKSKTLQ